MIFQLTVNGIIVGSIYALIALGFSLIYNTVRFFHFAHGIVFAAGAYFAYSLTFSLGFSSILSFFLLPYYQPSSECPLPGLSISP